MSETITTPSFEDTRLITPGELRAVLRDLRERAEKHEQKALNPEFDADACKTRASALRFAADQIGDLIQSALNAAEAEQAERQAERQRRQAEQAERDERALAHAEAYRNRPILGLREGDVLINFGNHSAPRWAGPPTDHIGFLSEDGSYYRARCGADVNAVYSARKTGDHRREATCKRCLAAARKDGLLA